MEVNRGNVPAQIVFVLCKAEDSEEEEGREEVAVQAFEDDQFVRTVSASGIVNKIPRMAFVRRGHSSDPRFKGRQE